MKTVWQNRKKKTWRHSDAWYNRIWAWFKSRPGPPLYFPIRLFIDYWKPHRFEDFTRAYLPVTGLGWIEWTFPILIPTGKRVKRVPGWCKCAPVFVRRPSVWAIDLLLLFLFFYHLSTSRLHRLASLPLYTFSISPTSSTCTLCGQTSKARKKQQPIKHESSTSRSPLHEIKTAQQHTKAKQVIMIRALPYLTTA